MKAFMRGCMIYAISSDAGRIATARPSKDKARLVPSWIKAVVEHVFGILKAVPRRSGDHAVGDIGEITEVKIEAANKQRD
jgi:hypothetical protein